MLIIDTLRFVYHKWDCDALQPMWHKGPCDCGLYGLLDKLLSTGLSNSSDNKEALVLLYQLYEAHRPIINDWEISNRKKLPIKLYQCSNCKHPTAEKQPDVQGWDGYCHCCGPIPQAMVGELEFSLVYV